MQAMQEVCHRLILNDDGCATASGHPTRVMVGELLSEPGNNNAGEDVDDDEEQDEVAPLPAMKKVAPLQVQQEQSHIVLLLDASGSMRTSDVEAQDSAEMVRRVDAALACAKDFVTQHARVNPNDLFSVAVFAEQVTPLCAVCSASAAVQALDITELQVIGGTRFLPALRHAQECLEGRGSAVGHVVLLSDGRPADTKDALHAFQDAFVWGCLSSTHLHGIAFGSTVESFAPLQQLASISGGTFALSGCSARGLCGAFASVSSSITSFKESTQQGRSSSRLAALRVDYEPPELVGVFGKKGVVRFNAVRASFRFDGQVFEKQEWDMGLVQRRQRPCMRGGMRLVFGFSDLRVVDASAGGWMVAKQSRFADPALNARPVVETHAKSTAVARHFAMLFDKRAKEVSMEVPALVFLPCFMYTIEDSAFKEVAAFTAERYLPGAFLKYNSNNGYVSEEPIRHHDVMQAFLHFSFIASGSRFAVTDLQGVARESEVLLTDPQVLTLAGGAFGPGDLGVRGLKACLASHRCGPTCRHLGLTPISGPVLRQLEAHGPKRLPGRTQSGPSEASSGSWEQVGEGGFGEMVWEDDARSSYTSGSSWVHVQ